MGVKKTLSDYSYCSAYKQHLLSQEVDEYISMWHSGDYKNLEDLWLALRELEVQVSLRGDKALTEKIEKVLLDISDQLWKKFKCSNSDDYL